MEFTVEEMNLLAIYMAGDKAQVAENIRGALPYVDEADMLEIMQRTIGKLDGMADVDFSVLDIIAEDDYDETEG